LIDSVASFCSDLINAGYSKCEDLKKVLQISIYEGMAEAIENKL